MSDVILGKGLLTRVSVSVLAGLLMSSAVMAEDDAAVAGSEGEEVSIEIIDGVLIEPPEEPLPGDETGTDTGTDTGEVPVELVDPICEDCWVDGPDVVIDPIETDGTVIDDGTVTEEDTPPEVYQTTALGGESQPNYRGETALNHQDSDSDGFVAPVKTQQTAREGGFFKWLFGKKQVNQ